MLKKGEKVDQNSLILSLSLTSPINYLYHYFYGIYLYILDRYMSQLRIPGYQAFLDFMCPGSVSVFGLLPPIGQDSDICDKPIVGYDSHHQFVTFIGYLVYFDDIGIWDDHDYGWNNGNKVKKKIKRFLLFTFIAETPLQAPL